MPGIKIKIGPAPKSETEDMEDESTGEMSPIEHEQHMADMQKGIKEAISMIDNNDLEGAKNTLSALLSEEQKEAGEPESAKELPTGIKGAGKDQSFSDAIKNAMEKGKQ